MSTDNPKTSGSRIKNFWLKYESKIVLIIGFILVAAISFEAGILKGQNWQQKPLIIEKTAGNEAVCPVQDSGLSSANKAPEQQNLPPASQDNALSVKDSTSADNGQNSQNCAFVGSKNSNKYHLPTCRWAKQIKPENLVCFSSAEDAAAKSYQPDKNCIK